MLLKGVAMKFPILALLVLLGACTAHIGAQVHTSVAPSTTGHLWVDTDLACEDGLFLSDPDDCLALILLMRARALIVGLSTTAGNAGALVAHRLATRLAGHLPVYAESASCDSPLLLGFAEAVKHVRVTVLALGPLTNIATILRCKPRLAMQIKEVVFVGGRRPGQRFVPNPQWPWNVELRDLNVEYDLEALRVVLGAGIAIRLIPFEAGHAVPLGFWSTNFIGSLPDFLTKRLQEWSLTSSVFWGSDGIMPFDPVAAAYTLWTEAFRCERVNLFIKENALEAQDDPKGSATYCTPRDPGAFKKLLLHWILKR